MTPIPHLRFLHADTIFQSAISKTDHIPLHTHEYLELVYVLSGSCRQMIDGNHVTISEGDYFIVERGIAHTYLRSDSDTFMIMNCLFSPKLISRSAASGEGLAQALRGNALNYQENHHWSSPAQIIFHDTSGQVREWIQAIHREYRIGAKGHIELIRNRILDILLTMLRTVAQDRTATAQSQLTEEMLMFVEANYDKPISLRDASASLHYSTNYISTLFKKQFGTTFSDYLQKVRIENACHLLRTTDMPIKSVYSICGYHDSAYFHRIFRKYIGLTPREYRDQAT